MITKDICLYIEQLRIKRNITIKDLTEGIISQRQYKRYLLNVSEMPNRIFFELTERLGFNSVKILHDVEEEKQKENKLVEGFYNDVVNRNFDEAKAFIRKYKKHQFLLPEFKMYFDASEALYYYQIKEYDKPKTAEIFKNLVNYPNVLEKSIFDQTELIILSLLLMMISDQQEKQILIDKLTTFILQDKLIVGTDLYAKQFIRLRLAREHGINGNDNKVIEICKQGLEVSRRPSIHFNYDFFYYYLALAYRNKKDMKTALYYIKNLYNYVMWHDDGRKVDSYQEKMKKDFDKTFEELLKEIE